MSTIIGKEHFTSNEEIDKIVLGDSTVDIVGFVDKIDTNPYSTGALYYKIIINNNAEKRVQVTAWRDKIKMSNKIETVHSIVHVSTAMARQPKSQSYNFGNVPFELLVKENTVITQYGTFEPPAAESSAQEVTIEEASRKHNTFVKIRAFLKSSFRKFKHQNFEYMIGSITDGENKLEVRCNCNDLIEVNDFAYKGMEITVSGIMQRYPPGSPQLKIEGAKSVEIVSNGKMLPLAELLNGYRTPK